MTGHAGAMGAHTRVPPRPASIRRETRSRRFDPPPGRRSGEPQASLLGLEVAGLVGTCIVVWWLSARFVHPIWSWIALAEFLWLSILCFRLEPQGFALLLPIAITRASVVVALIAIEYGARLPELGLSGTPGPYTTSYVFLSALLFASCLALFRAMVKLVRPSRLDSVTATFDRFAVWISAAIVAAGLGATLWLLAIGAARGFPLLVNMDRFVFRRLYADNLTLNILNCKALLGGALGLVAFCIPVGRRWKHAASATCLIFVSTNFLFGDKFFSILVTASCFFGPYLYIHHQVARRRFGLFIGLAALLMLPVLGVTWFIYSNQGRASVESTSQRLGERFAAQGELWYLQSRIGGPLTKWSGPFVADNLEAMSIKNVELFALRRGLGPGYFMNLYSPDKLRAAQGRNAGTVTFTMALEPLMLAKFGWLGLFAAMFMSGGLFALGSLYVAYAIERRLVLSMIFSGYLMVLMRSFATQGGPWVVASVFTAKWLSIVLLIELCLLLLAASHEGFRLGTGDTLVPNAGRRRGAGSSP